MTLGFCPFVVLCVLGLVASPLVAAQHTHDGTPETHLEEFHLEVPHDFILDAFDFNGDHQLNRTEFLCLVLSLPIDLTTHGEEEETSHSGHDHRNTRDAATSTDERQTTHTESHEEMHEACPYVYDEDEHDDHDEYDSQDNHGDHDSHDHRRAIVSAQHQRALRAIDAIVWAAKDRKTTLRKRRRARAAAARRQSTLLTTSDPFELMVCDEEDTFAVFEVADTNVDEELDATEVTLAMPYLLELVIRCSVEESSACSPPTVAQYWGWAILSVVLISLTSLCGIAVIPFLHKNWHHFVSDILIAFAVGALVGDALMHLLPAAYGAHAHGEGPESTVEVEPVYLGALAVVSVLAFFIVERIMRHLHETHPVVLKNDEAATGETSEAMPDDEAPMTPRGRKKKEAADGNESEDDVVVRMSWRDVDAVGYLNLTSDLFHNFADGLALGATFAYDLRLGMGTAIAVFFHEVPQELGDFAILIRAGFSYKQALLFNFLTSLSSLIGVVIALAAATAAASVVNALQYLLAIAAGTFLYIGLADMTPELFKHMHSTRKQVLQVLFMVLGFTAMFLLGVFEGGRCSGDV